MSVCQQNSSYAEDDVKQLIEALSSQDVKLPLVLAKPELKPPKCGGTVTVIAINGHTTPQVTQYNDSKLLTMKRSQSQLLEPQQVSLPLHTEQTACINQKLEEVPQQIQKATMPSLQPDTQSSTSHTPVVTSRSLPATALRSQLRMK